MFAIRRNNKKYIGGNKMLFAGIIAWINIVLILTISILAVYALILLIKALNIYIKKNS